MKEISKYRPNRHESAFKITDHSEIADYKHIAVVIGSIDRSGSVLGHLIDIAGFEAIIVQQPYRFRIVHGIHATIRSKQQPACRVLADCPNPDDIQACFRAVESYYAIFGYPHQHPVVRADS